MLFNVLYLITGWVEAFVTFMFFDRFLERRKGFTNIVYIFGTIGLAVVYNLLVLTIGSGYLNMALMAVAAFCFSLLYSADIKVGIIIAMINEAILTGAEMLVLVVLMLVFQTTALETVLTPTYAIMGMILSKTIYYMIIKLICMFGKRRRIRMTASYWIVYITVFCVILATLAALFYRADGAEMLSLLCAAGLLYSSLATLFLYERMSVQAEKIKENELLAQKEEYDRRHAKDIEELYAKTCAIRHDMLNHFTAIKGLLDEDSGKAREYVRSVTQGEIQSIRPLIRTDNSSFDAIANAKLAVCESNGIKVSTRIMDGALTRLTDYEIASLFGNLFDNAIDASKNSEGKRIELDVCVQKDQLSIFMRNTIDGSVLEGNSGLKTTKANKELHGLGTKNIKRIVDKHNGIINYFEEDGYFCCDILM